MTTSTHVILTHRVELDVDAAAVARRVQDAWIDRWSSGLEAALGTALDAAEARHGPLALDRLDVDLGTLALGELVDLPQRLMQAIPRAIADAVNRAPRAHAVGGSSGAGEMPPSMADTTEHAARAVMHVAKCGYRPWWAPDVPDATLADGFVAWCATDPPAGRAARAALRSDRAALSRLASCFGQTAVAALGLVLDAPSASGRKVVRAQRDALGPSTMPSTTLQRGVSSGSTRVEDTMTPAPTAGAYPEAERRMSREPTRSPEARGSADPELADHIAATPSSRGPGTPAVRRSSAPEELSTAEGPLEELATDKRRAAASLPEATRTSTATPGASGGYGVIGPVGLVDPLDDMSVESSRRPDSTAARTDTARGPRTHSPAGPTSRAAQTMPGATMPSGEAAPVPIALATRRPSSHRDHCEQPAGHPGATAAFDESIGGAQPAEADPPRRASPDPVDAHPPASAPPVEEPRGAGPYRRRPVRAGERIPARNAGLVLVWPFLPRTFRALGWWDGSAWKADGQAHAIHWLHRLASVEPARARSGALDAPSGTLLLPRLLCGLPLDAPISRRWSLSDVAHDAADELLQAMVSHWSALGRTSPDGLRQAFICRDGLLTHLGPDWHLRVDRRAHDVLLERLPWGFGTVRLRWTPYTLGVEW